MWRVTNTKNPQNWRDTYVNKIFTNFDGNLEQLYTSIDVTDSSFEELIEKYQIHSVPTLVKLNGDKVVDKFVGIMTVDKLKEWVK